MKITITSDDGKVVVPVPTDDIDFADTLNRMSLEERLWDAVYKVADHEIKNPPTPVTAGRAVHREPVRQAGQAAPEWFSHWPMEKCSECGTPTRYWLDDAKTPLCRACSARPQPDSK